MSLTDDARERDGDALAARETAAAPRALTSGVTVVSAAPIAAADVETIVHDVASAAGARRVWGADDDALGSLAFAEGLAGALTIVRRVPADVASGRPDLVILLGAPVADALRLDVLFDRAKPAAFARADAALVAIASALAATAPAIVVDDLGSIYDPAELARLAAASLPRALAFSYALAVARGASAAAALDLAPPPLPAIAPRDVPASLAATAASEPENGRIVFDVLGPHLPVLDLARVTLALMGDPHANQQRLPVALNAPLIGAREGLRLAALGVAVDAAAPATATAVVADETPARGESVDIFASALTAADTIAVLERMTQDLIEATIATSAGAPVRPHRVTIGAAATAAASDFPRVLASLAFGDATVTIAHLDVASAAAVIATFVRARADLALLAGGTIGAVVSIEASAPSPAAEVLIAVLAAELVTATNGVAVDAPGAVYGADELTALAAQRRTLASSWSRAVRHVENQVR